MKTKKFLIWLMAVCACVWMVHRMNSPAKSGNEAVQVESACAKGTVASRSSGGKLVSRLNRRNENGRIAVSSKGNRLPAKAEVAMARTEAEDARAKIAAGLSVDPSTVLAMYDISINSDGQKWQPAPGEPVQVSVELPEPVEVTPGSTLGLVHLADNGSVERLPANRYDIALNSAKTAVTGFTFLADGFSVYAITQDGTPGLRVYSFYNLSIGENNTEIYEPHYFIATDGSTNFQQIVKSGEMLEQPEALPSPNGITFAGWYLYDEAKAGQTVDGVTYGTDGYADQPFDFKQAVIFSDAGQEEFILRAVYAHKAYVVFHEQKTGDKWPIIGVRGGKLTYNAATGKWETTVRVNDISATYDDPEDEHNEQNGAPKMIFRGWSLTEVEEGSEDYELVEDPFPISLDLANMSTNDRFQAINLYPVFVNINWITYYTAEAGSGATYVAPTYHYEDTGIESLTNEIHLTGYTFTGWYTDTNETTRVQISDANGVLDPNADLPDGWGGYFSDGKLMLSDSVTIYAGWAPAPTKYTVVVLKQSINDDVNATEKTYDFEESHSITGKNTGDLTDTPTAYQNLSFGGFYYSRTDDNKVIRADGSTVINVYYDRYKVTYTFYRNSTGSTLYNSIPNPTMTGLYGQMLSKYGYTWPIDQLWGVRNGSTTMTYLESFNYIIDTNPTSHTMSTSFYRSSSNGSDKIYHILQRLDGSYSTNYVETAIETRCNGGNFSFTHKFGPAFSLWGFSEGTFTENPSNNASVNGENGKASQSNGRYPLYVYHKRNTYTISFYDSYNTQLYAITNVYYGAQLSTNIVPASCASPKPTDPGIQDGFEFKGWYSDEDTTTRFDFNRTMPMNNLVAYARWGKVYYLIKVNPNYGELGGGDLGSTWFWEPAFGGEEIREYKTTERNYEESIDGTYYYAEHVRSFYGLTDEWEDREDEDPFKTEISDRRTYYTTDQADPAIVDTSKRYSYAPKAYRYSSWYEVFPDGSETIYAFGQQITHNTVIKLHWKKIGTYHLVYMAGLGTINDDDESENGAFKTIDGGFYADSSEVLVTRTAEPPPGYAFIGWKIRYGGDTVYRPGQSFSFNSGYTVTGTDTNGNSVKQLILDAVYSPVTTVRLTLDGNGGALASDYTGTGFTLDEKLQSEINATTNESNTALTYTGMRNNYFGTLDNGSAGLTCNIDGTELEFAGWNTKADGSGTAFDPGAKIYLNSDDTDANGNNTLYAQWRVKVYFDKNNDNAQWGTWDMTKYTFDEDKGMYYQNTTLNGYADDPNAALTGDPEHMFQFWSEVRYELTDEYSNDQEYNFSTPVTRTDLVLYARWWKLLEVPIHAVDASGQTLVGKDNEWLKKDSDNNPITKINMDAASNFSFSPTPAAYVDASAVTGYEFAFACISDDIDNISESSQITGIFYNIEAKHVYVTFIDGSTGELPEDNEIYFVYYQNPKPVDIGYVKMDIDGSLPPADLTTTTRPTTVEINTVAYNMSTNIAAMSYRRSGSPYTYYAYAIGDKNADSSSALHVITGSKNSDTDEPQLQVKNSWRGYQYSTDSGTTWNTYGYDMQLYVVYFESQPTIISLKEQTIGTEADMSERFEYNVAVTNIETKTTQKQTATRYAYLQSGIHSWTGYYTEIYVNGTRYYISSSSWDWNNSGSAVSTNTATEVSNETYNLIDSETEMITLLYNSNNTTQNGTEDITVSGPNSSGRYTLTNTRTNTTFEENKQEVTITQTVKPDFTTEWSDSESRNGTYVYTNEAATTPTTRSVTYTNTRTGDSLELHLALAQGKAVSLKDSDWRHEDEGHYKLDITLGAESLVTTSDLLARTNSAVAATYLLKNDADTTGNRFAGVYYGTTNEAGVVTIEGAVKEVGFVKPTGSEYYELVVKTDDDATVPLDDCALFYVYTEMPKIYYMNVGANGALTEINPIRYDDSPIAMNGETAGPAAQGAELALNADVVFTVKTGGNADANKFGVPVVLDGVALKSRNRSAFAVGKDGVTATAAMDGTTTGDTIQLKIDGGFVKWSTDGTNWNDFSGAPAVYAIYKEIGYDLELSVTSLASDTDKATDEFTVTIACPAFSESVSYAVSGYAVGEEPVETLTPAADHTITLTVKSGCDLTIHALPYGERDQSGTPVFYRYTITETLPSDLYQVKVVNVDNYQTASPVANGTDLYMESDKTVEFVNVKKYTVTFKDEAGQNVLQVLGEDGENMVDSKPYLYGTAVADITKPEIPAKEWSADKTTIYRFKGWDPVLEPVASNSVYNVSYRAITVPQAEQRSTGDMLTIKLDGLTEAQLIALLKSLDSGKLDLEKSDYTVTAANKWLNTEDANGLKRWENIVTGTAYTQDLLTGMSSDSETSQMNMRIWDKPVALTDLGYTVRYVLQKTTGTGWSTIAGPTTAALAVNAARPAMSVPLLDNEGKSAAASGLYRVVTQIIPNQYTLSGSGITEIVNEIPSKNIDGILEVNSTYTNVVVASPWVACDTDKPAAATLADTDTDADVNVTIEKLMANTNLASGDKIYAYDTATKVHYGWTMMGSRGDIWWDPMVSATQDGMTIAEPTSSTMPRGGAYWLVRSNPLTDAGSMKPIFVCGQHQAGDYVNTIPGGSQDDPKSVLLANPTMSDVAVNSLRFSGTIGNNDTIWVPSANPNVATTYRRKNGVWEKKTYVYIGKRKTTEWVAEGSIPSGTGFWYVRRTAGDLTLTWDGWKETAESADTGTDGE